MQNYLRPPIIYVTGPLSAFDVDGKINMFTVARNITEAKRVGFIVAQLGGMPVIPHTNTGSFFNWPDVAESHWIAGCLELVRRSDAIVTIEEWQYSTGAQKEMRLATDRRMPIFHNVVDETCGPAQALRDWITGFMEVQTC